MPVSRTGWKTIGALYRDVAGSPSGLDLVAIGARSDLTEGQWELLPGLSSGGTLPIRVPQPQKWVPKEYLWHAEVRLLNEAAAILQIAPKLVVVSRPIVLTYCSAGGRP